MLILTKKRFASSSSCCFLVAAYQWETSRMLQDVHFHIDVIDVPRTSDRHLPPGPGRHHRTREKSFFCFSQAFRNVSLTRSHLLAFLFSLILIECCLSLTPITLPDITPPLLFEFQSIKSNIQTMVQSEYGSSPKLHGIA